MVASMAPPRLVLFTYGSMQPGGPDAAHLGPLRWARRTVLARHDLYDSRLGWPFATAGGSCVHGTLVELETDDPVERLRHLDRLSGFERDAKATSAMVRVRLMVGSGRQKRCAWIYVSSLDRIARLHPHARPERVHGGDWRAHRPLSDSLR